MRGWLQNQARRVDAGQQVNIKAPPGYELAHRPRFENDSGYDYSHADPMLAADHRGIQHCYWRKRNGCWSAKMPSSGSPGTGKLSLPKAGSLP
nr:polymorphic toxin type 8 domain-containing protein [Burkholderia gladioli]